VQSGEDTTTVANRILNSAILAPSSHNTQPWLFELRDNKIKIFANHQRQLRASDTNNRELMISIGCCLENIVVASSHFGYRADVVFSNQINSYNYSFSEDKFLAEISLSIDGNSKKNNDAIFSSITKHRSNKFFYRETTVARDVILKMEKIASELGGKLDFIVNKSEIASVASLVAEGTRHAFGSKEFRKELSSWVHNNYSRSCDGMPAYTVGMPGPISLLGPLVIRLFNIGASEAKKAARTVSRSPAVGIISVTKDLPRDWIVAGRIYQGVNLMAISMGLSTAVMGAPIEVAEVRNKLQDLIKLESPPLLFFRLGYPEKTAPLSPRLSLEDCLL
jgi:hypothetical protein